MNSNLDNIDLNLDELIKEAASIINNLKFFQDMKLADP